MPIRSDLLRLMFPQLLLDAAAYSAFISKNGITRRIIIGDKGFPESAAHEQFEQNPDLHYLNPVKRNSKLIERHHIMDFTALLPGHEGITYRKEKCIGTGKWLYSYRDSCKAAKEESDWLRRARKNRAYSLDALRKKQESFRTIVLECDLELPPGIEGWTRMLFKKQLFISFTVTHYFSSQSLRVRLATMHLSSISTY